MGGFCLITTTVYLGHFLWPGAPVPGHPSGDLPLQFWPMRALVARRLTAGGFPAWNPHIYCGTPLLANFVSGVFYPPNLLFAWLSPANAVRAYWAIHLVAAQLFSWLWLRRTVGGTGFPLAGAVLIVFSGPWLSHLHAGHLNSVAAMTWMPLIGWLVLRCLDAGATAASAVRADAGNATAPGSAPKASKQGRPTAPADLAVSGPGLAGALMLQIFAGQPQYVYFTLCAILVGLGWRLVRPPPPERRDWAGPARVLGWLGVGLLLAGVQIGPGLAFAAVSARSAASAAWSGGFSLPASHLVTLVLPDFFGSLTGLSYHGEWYQWETNSYVGLFMGWLFLLALADRRGWPATLPAIAATVGVVVLALGDQTPVHGWLVRLGTGLRWFRGPAKWLALLPPLLAVAAGRAFAVHFDGGSAQTGPIGSTSQGGPVARSFAATPGRQSDRSERHQPLPGQSELTTERIVPSNHPACSSRAAGDAHTSSTPAAWRPARLSRCPLLTAAAMLAGIAALWLWRGDDAHAVARALAMTTSPAFLAEAAPIRDPAFGQHLGHAHQEQFAGLATQGGVLLLLVILGAFDPQRRQSIGRLMLALAVIDQLRFARHDRPACHPLPPLPAAVTATIARVPHHPRVVYVGLPANRAMLDGTQTPGGHDALMLSHASEYLHHSQGLPASASRLGFAIDRFGPLTDLAGVALTVIGPGVEGQHPDWIRVHDHGDVRCDLNRRAVPRAFVVRRVVAIDDATTALHWLADPARAAMACAVVASAAGVEDLLHDPAHDAGSGQAVPAPLPVFIRDEPESVELEVQAGQPGLLVLQDAWAPGWHATVDGRVTPVLRVNHAFRGVRLDAGPHRVHFAYQPPGLAAGLAATFLGLSLTIWRLALRFRRYSKQQGYQGR